MPILQTRTFARRIKKLHPNQKQDLDKAIKHLLQNPLDDRLKTSNLTTVRVYKFKMLGQLSLLAYTWDKKSKIMTLLALGLHENFYRDLSRG